jgi:hypothetical protein
VLPSLYPAGAVSLWVWIDAAQTSPVHYLLDVAFSPHTYMTNT